MGLNTVAILYNDRIGDLANDASVGKRIQSSMLHWSVRSKAPTGLNFGYGAVVSQDHADYSQVVIIGQNRGVRAADAENVDWIALEQMKQCLERHGYSVKKRRPRKKVDIPLAAVSD